MFRLKDESRSLSILSRFFSSFLDVNICQSGCVLRNFLTVRIWFHYQTKSIASLLIFQKTANNTNYAHLLNKFLSLSLFWSFLRQILISCHVAMGLIHCLEISFRPGVFLWIVGYSFHLLNAYIDNILKYWPSKWQYWRLHLELVYFDHEFCKNFI